MHLKLKRLLSFAIAFLITLSIVPANAIAVGNTLSDAVSSSGVTVPGGINGYQATIWADPDTSDGYKNAFTGSSIPSGAPVEISGDTSRSSALNGKVWADKSIVPLGDSELNTPNGNFNIALSALGQTYSYSETSQSQVAYDVVFVLDFSGSMAENTKASNMVAAVNTSIKALMENENNRIGIVAYSGSAGTISDTTEFLPLDRYTSSENNGNFLEYTWRGSIRTTRPGFGSNDTPYVKNSSGETVDKSKTVTGGTPTQAGIYSAMQMLQNGVNNATGIDSGVARIPAIILLTDGQPGVAYSGYTDLTGTQYEGSAHSENDDDYVGAYTILTANYVKSQVSATYWNKYQQDYQKIQGISQDNVAKIYSIGLGISSNSWTHFVLDPGITASDSTITSIKSILSQDAEYGNNYNYCTEYQGGEDLTEQQLQDIFKDFLEDIQSGGIIEIPTESVGNREKITFFDDLGEAVQINGDFTLTVPTYTVSGETIVNGGKRVYTLSPYDISSNTKLEDDMSILDAVENKNGVAMLATHVDIYDASDSLTGGYDIDPYADEADYANIYDKTAVKELEITITEVSSTLHRIQAEIPSQLMAYNILSYNDGQYSYYESEPLALEYTVRIKDDVSAGDYLTNVINNSSLQFVPSSTQVDGGYQMPYYWDWFQYDADNLEKNKTDKIVEGASDYIYSTRKNNNLIQIYLGNNARISMAGKTLTYHLYWDDNNNQDGLRFKNIDLKLYRETVAENISDIPTVAPVNYELVGTYKFGEANATADDSGAASNLWEKVFENLPVYSQDGTYLRYWLQMSRPEGTVDNTSNGYSADIYSDLTEHGKGTLINQGEWMCFETDQGLLADAELCVKLHRTASTLNFTVNKIWENKEGKTLPDVTVQLMANGKKVVNVSSENVFDEFAIEGVNGTAVLNEGNNWQYVWSNLPAYMDGSPITYQAVEINAAEGDTPALVFTTSYTHTSAEYDSNRVVVVSPATSITNTIVDTLPETVTLSIVKAWDDGNNQDGLRPDEIKLTLTAAVNGSDITHLLNLDQSQKELIMSANDAVSGNSSRWETTWENLPRTYQGQIISYSVTEDVNDSHYTSNVTVIGGYNVYITNTHTPATRTITLKKSWDDDNNRDGIRPNAVTGGIYTKNADNTFSLVQKFSITGNTETVLVLDQSAGGSSVEYYISEDTVNGYSLADITGATKDNNELYYKINGSEVTLINSHSIFTEEYIMNFQWDDSFYTDGRPEKISVLLTDDSGKTYSVELTVNKENGQISAPVLTGDGDPNVTVEVVSDGTSLKFKNLPSNMLKTDPSSTTAALAYVAQASDPDGDGPYSVTKADVARNSNTFIYSRPAPEVDLILTKVWDDNSDNEGSRPTVTEFVNDWLTISSTAGAFANSDWSYTVNNNTWTITFYGQPMYYNGALITYTASENLDGTGYISNTGSDSVTFINGKAEITNSYNADPQYYEKITVIKYWNDNDNDQNLRPDFPEGYSKGGHVTDPLNIRLYNGLENEANLGIEPDSIVENTQNNNWIYTWNNVPKMLHGNAINYTAYENADIDNYTAIVRYVYMNNSGGDYTGSITNSFSSSSTNTGSLTINKVWNDSGYDRQHTEPLSFTIYGITDGSSSGTVYNIVMDVPEEDGEWSVTQNNLPLVSGGKTVKYYVVENNVPENYIADYSVSSSSAVPLSALETTKITVTNTYSPVNKLLSYNANGGNGSVPDHQIVPESQNSAVVAAKPDDLLYPGAVFLGWSKYAEPLITEQEQLPETLYSEGDIVPVTKSAVLYAVWAVDANGNDVPDYLEQSVTVTVVWDDSRNQDGIRPESITLNLLANKIKYDSQTLDLSLGTQVLMGRDDNGNTTWSYTWSGLPVKSGDDEITYTVTEEPITSKHDGCEIDSCGYTVTYSGSEGASFVNDGVATIINTHVPETVSHTVKKVWDHAENTPSEYSSVIQLLANGQPLDIAAADTEITLPDQASGNSYTWTQLPKYDQGVLVTYHAVEISAASSLTDTAGEYRVDYQWSDAETVITNIYGFTRDITLLYSWDDNGNTELRPDTLTVALTDEYGNIINGSSKEISGAGKDVWTCFWTNLAVDDDEGNAINYHAVILQINGEDIEPWIDGDELRLTELYSFDYSEYGLNNNVIAMKSALLNPDKQLTVSKEWVVPENYLLPQNVYLQLFADGILQQTLTFSDADALTEAKSLIWSRTVTVPTNDASGKLIDYTVQEIPVQGYDSDVDNVNLKVTNTLSGYIPEENEKVNLTFVYENAYAIHNGQSISSNTPIELPYASSYEFTAIANSGYVLSDVSYDPDKVTMQAYGGGKYEIKLLTSDATVTIKAVQQSTVVPDSPSVIRPSLEKGEHFAYIVGYPDDAVRPNNNITRAEVATIFFRLLTEDSRQEYYCEVNNFSDVSQNDWYNNAISTLYNAKIISGYPDGTFRPDAQITRAELAAIASRFDDLTGGDCRLTDIRGHWAEEYIISAYSKGWVDGYPDGTFRPNQFITRAEVMTLINRVLERSVSNEGMLDNMITWIDNPATAWYYEAVQEATNSHNYSRGDGETLEKWTEITPARDWTQLEK